MQAALNHVERVLRRDAASVSSGTPCLNTRNLRLSRLTGDHVSGRPAYTTSVRRLPPAAAERCSLLCLPRASPHLRLSESTECSCNSRGAEPYWRVLRRDDGAINELLGMRLLSVGERERRRTVFAAAVAAGLHIGSALVLTHAPPQPLLCAPGQLQEMEQLERAPVLCRWAACENPNE